MERVQKLNEDMEKAINTILQMAREDWKDQRMVELMEEISLIPVLV
jgi:hypothetical protein